MANWVRYPLSLFGVFPPWRACEVEVRYPPPQKGYLSDTCAIPYENKANGCDTPLRYYLERVLRDMGGVSRTGPLSPQSPKKEIPSRGPRKGAFGAFVPRHSSEPKMCHKSAKTKRGRREGDGKKTSRQFATNVTTIYDILRQLATFYDNFHLFVPLT